MATRYREFKCELHDYFLEFGSPEEALANPPIEMDARPRQWEFLCKHFQSDRFLRQSNANKINRKKRPYEHHAGACPFSYIVEEYAEAGSQFPEIDTFEVAYGGKNKNITNDTAKAKFDEMNAKREEYIKELAKNYPDDTPSEDIIVTDKDAGIKILTDVLGVKRGNEVRGFGTGRVRELKESTLRTQQLEKELAAEKAAKDEAQQTLTLFMKGWEQTMQQLAQQLPGFTPPQIFVPPHTNSDQQLGEEEDNS